MNAVEVLGARGLPDNGRVGRSDPYSRLGRRARARGIRMHEPVGVSGNRAGRVAGIETILGTVRCNAIALCTGLWSQERAASANVEAPVRPSERFHLHTGRVGGVEGKMPTPFDRDVRLCDCDDSHG